MKPPTAILMDEHQVILRALDLLEQAAAHPDVGDAWWATLIEWLRAFADRNHHAKEEDALFPAMVAGGVPQEGGPIGVMLAEHDQGRALVRAMAGGAGPARATSAQRYVRLLRAHIDKEDGILFPMAEAVLEEGARHAVAAAFARVADTLGGQASIDHARATLETLAADLGSACSGRAG